MIKVLRSSLDMAKVSGRSPPTEILAGPEQNHFGASKGQSGRAATCSKILSFTFVISKAAHH